MIFYVNLGKLSDEDHKKVVKALNSDQTVRDWIHCLDSSWLVDTAADHTDQAINPFNRALGNPSCLILPVFKHYYGMLNKEVWAWLKKKQLPDTPKQPDTKAVEEQQAALAGAIEVSAAKELDAYVGLGTGAGQIADMMAGIAFRQAAHKAGLQLEQGFANVLIAGAPGTGKTSLAQTLAFMLREAMPGGSKQKIFMVKAADLIDRHVGKSANNTKALLDKASGGIVILDEIDTIMDVSHYGHEVLNTLNTHIGHAPNRPVIIATLYSSREQDFRNFNAGFSSRFPYVHRLPSYGDDALLGMFVKKVTASGFSLTPAAEQAAAELIAQIRRGAGRNFGFGREVDNMFSFVINRVAHRYALLGDAEKKAFESAAQTETGQAVRASLLAIDAQDIPLRDGVSGGFVARPAPANDSERQSESAREKQPVVIPFPAPRPRP